MTELQIAAYVDIACASAGIVLAPDERDSVIAHFTRSATIAAPLLEVPLSPDVEIAPVFRP